MVSARRTWKGTRRDVHQKQLDAHTCTLASTTLARLTDLGGLGQHVLVTYRLFGPAQLLALRTGRTCARPSPLHRTGGNCRRWTGRSALPFSLLLYLRCSFLLPLPSASSPSFHTTSDPTSCCSCGFLFCSSLFLCSLRPSFFTHHYERRSHEIRSQPPH